jgi:hypothetical protein
MGRGRRRTRQQMTPDAAVGQIEDGQRDQLSCLGGGVAEQLAGQLANEVLNRPVQPAQPLQQRRRQRRTDQIGAADGHEQLGVSGLAEDEVEDRQAACDHRFGRLAGGFDGGDAVPLRPLDGTNPQLGQQRLPGVEAVVDRSWRGAAGTSDVADRRGGEAFAEHQAARTIEDLVRSVELESAHNNRFILKRYD